MCVRARAAGVGRVHVLKSLADALVWRAQRRGTIDNVTVVVIILPGEREPGPAASYLRM